MLSRTVLSVCQVVEVVLRGWAVLQYLHNLFLEIEHQGRWILLFEYKRKRLLAENEIPKLEVLGGEQSSSTSCSGADLGIGDKIGVVQVCLVPRVMRRRY